MSRRLLAVGFLVAAAIAGGCQHASPQLHVLGVQSSALREVVFVQVTNPTSRPMKLTKLEYTFAADGATVSTGEVELSRDVQPGAAVLVEVPLEAAPSKPMTLTGQLTAELDQIVRIFSVSERIAPQ
jgi:LEA14-like dessication related protein